MEITLSNGADGKVELRTSYGHFMACVDMEQAVAYANGLQEGWNAAAHAIGRCHGFRNEVRP